jgi:redox-sensitive bicupin YhaK (pirin superfamily)
MAILKIQSLGFPWWTQDPFLFCAHHNDAYPKGNADLGPASSLAGRRIGMDFDRKDGWSMYHGDVVPGFPRHPHRGFETITLARQGYVDHSDSMGATARFGNGDVQWMTAGRGVVHSEMFPLIKRDQENPTELFQVWLNLPHADKMVEPHFTMLWDHTIPKAEFRDESGKLTRVAVVAGQLGELAPPSPPPSSWASHSDADVSVLTIKMEAGAKWTLPGGSAGSNRTLYFFVGASATVAGKRVDGYHGVVLEPDADVDIEAGSDACEFLVLHGRPIGEKVVHYGPFVMTTPEEIQQAIVDYRRTEYGGWPWDSDGPVHAADEGRFAKHADGKLERPDP